MANTEKGKQGFQKVDEPRDQRMVYYLTKKEKERLMCFMERYFETHSDLIRKQIAHIIDEDAFEEWSKL